MTSSPTREAAPHAPPAASTSGAPEAKWLHILVALHALAITLPYFWAALIVPEGSVWGGLLYSPDDQNVHLAWARQARDGAFFARDLFTTENLADNSRPLFFNALTFVIGLLSRVTTIDSIFIYHAVRVASAILGLYALHALTKRWSNDWRVRISTVTIAAFAGGAGWLASAAPQVLAGLKLVDRVDGPLMMPEAWGFASNFVFALNAASFLLLCIVYEKLNRARDGDRKAMWMAAGAALLLSNIHTYDALPLIATIFVASLVEMRGGGARGWKPSVVVIIAAAIPVLWQLVVFRGSEEFRIKALTPTPAPPILDLLLTFSPLLILATIGVAAMRSERLQVLAAGRVWPGVWLAATALLIYAPVSFARKMIEGVHIPLAFLAALGLVALTEKMPSKVSRLSWASGMALLSISMVNFAAWCVSPATWADNSISRGLIPPLYLSTGDAEALKYLDALPASDKAGRAILCYPKLGSYVPRATGASTYAGHWAETLNLTGRYSKLNRVLDFYGGKMSAEQARAWLRDNRIGWVIEGQYEAAIGSGVAARYPNLKLEAQKGETRVFRVVE